MRALIIILVTALGAGACERETRVVRWDPPLGNLPKAETGMPFTRSWQGYTDPTAVPPDKLVLEDEDGKKTLVAKTGRHLMVHIYNCLQSGDRALFTDQVLSEITKREYYQRGKDPGEAFDTLRKRANDVQDLFDLMPGGEFTPGVVARPVGGKVRRIELAGPAARGLYWTGIDIVMEKGNYKLRWFVTPG